MENINIILSKKERIIKSISNETLGLDGENLQEKLIFSFCDDFVNGQARLEYFLPNRTGSYLVLTKVNETYQIPVRSLLLQQGVITLQLVITEGVNEIEIPIFKSNTFEMKINDSLNTVEIEAPEGYASWLELANTKLNQMDNFDIDASKTDSIATVTVTNRLGTEKSVQIRDGYDIDYNWDGTSLGIKGEDEQEYQYVDLQGEQGIPGYTPQKGVDYYTASEKAELESEIEDYVINSSTSAFNQNATQKTNDFNSNASSKTTTFNNNATSKTSDFDSNASSKTTAFNNNATSKTGDFDSHVSGKTSDFDSHVTSKTNDFNSNASSKTTAFNDNATDKQGAYDSNHTTKLGAYNDNAAAKTTAYNENHTAKLEAYNNNADDKIDEFDEHAEELQNEVDYWKTTYNSMAKVTGNGTNVTLEDTGNSPMKMELKPSTISQVTTTGKNLANIGNYTYNSRGVKTVVNTNHLQCTGTATGTTVGVTDENKENIFGTGDICFSCTNAPGTIISLDFLDENEHSTKRILINSSSTQGNNYVTLDANDVYYSLSLFPNINDTINIDTYLQIEKGSSVTSYEPYTGAIPSPNPSYPQDIHVVTGDNEIKVGNKNLLNIDATQLPSNDWYKYNSENQKFTIKQGSGAGALITIPINISLEVGDIISTSIICEQGQYSDGTIQIGTYHNTGTASWQGRVDLPRNTNLKNNIYKTENFVINDTIESFTLFVYGVQTVSENIVFKVQVEKKSTVTSYEPYQSQTFPLTLGNLEYCKIGDYSDVFTKPSGKNLLFETITNASISSNGIITGSGDLFDLHIARVKQGQTYIASGIASNPSSYDFVCGFFTDIPEMDSITYNNSRIVQSVNPLFTAPINGYVAIRSNTGLTNCQLEKGSSATEYEPYNDGKWYLKKNVGKVVFDGSESWSISSIKDNNDNIIGYRYNLNLAYLQLPAIQNTSTYYSTSFANYFKNINNTVFIGNVDYSNAEECMQKHGNSIVAYNTGEDNRILILHNDYFTLEDYNLTSFKNWLSTHNTELCYPLVTPTYTLLNDTLQAQLNAIYEKALSYQDQTNISQVNDDLPFVIKASACYDLNKLVERVATLETE